MENQFDKLVPIEYLSYDNPQEWAKKGRIALYQELRALYDKNGGQPFKLNKTELSKKLGIPEKIISKLIKWYSSDCFLQVIRQTIYFKGKSTNETFIGFSHIELIIDEDFKTIDRISHGIEIKPQRVKEYKIADDDCGKSLYRIIQMKRKDYANT